MPNSAKIRKKMHQILILTTIHKIQQSVKTTVIMTAST